MLGHSPAFSLPTGNGGNVQGTMYPTCLATDRSFFPIAQYSSLVTLSGTGRSMNCLTRSRKVLAGEATSVWLDTDLPVKNCGMGVSLLSRVRVFSGKPLLLAPAHKPWR